MLPLIERGRNRLLRQGRAVRGVLAHLFRRELNFNDFMGLVGGRFPFPAVNRVYRGRRQYRMSAFDLGGFHCAIRRHNCIQLDNALQ
jgi:hypothetical protein